MHNAIKGRVGQPRISDVLVPVFDGQLPGDDGRAFAVAIFDHFQKIFFPFLVERRETKVVELCGAPHKSINVECAVMCTVPGMVPKDHGKRATTAHY